MGEAIALDIGYTEHYIRKGRTGKEFVKKYIVRPHLSKIRNLERRISPKDAFHKHISRDLNGNGYDQELKTWRLWKDAGIKTLDLIESDNGEIVWNYLEAPSARLYLEGSNNNFEESIFSSYLEVYSNLRHLAKESGNSDFFHNDPWLKNYLVDNGEVMPIDGGVKLRDDFSIDKLDTCLNRISLYSIATLDVGDKNKKNYIEMFREVLLDSEAAKVMDFNSSLSLSLKLYFGFREEVVSRLKNRPKMEIGIMSKEFEKAKKDHILGIF